MAHLPCFLLFRENLSLADMEKFLKSNLPDSYSFRAVAEKQDQVGTWLRQILSSPAERKCTEKEGLGDYLG